MEITTETDIKKIEIVLDNLILKLFEKDLINSKEVEDVYKVR